MEHTQTYDVSAALGAGVSTAAGGGRLVGSDRVPAVLKELARHPDGVGLDELTRAIGGRCVLGDEFLRVAFAHHEARPEHVRVRPVFEALAQRFGESAHYAVLDGHEVVHRAQADPNTGAVRVTSTIGGRSPAHTTAVGKLLPASRLTTPHEVAAWLGDTLLERRTPRSPGTAAALHRELVATRERGYGVDDQETEAEVNCRAQPVYLVAPTVPSGAVRVSAPAYRTPPGSLVAALDEIRGLLGELGEVR